LVTVDAAGTALIRLQGYDTITASNKLTYSIASTTTDGSLYQLSSVFSSYGYEPKRGSSFASTPTIVTGSQKRVYYERPASDRAGINKWDTFTYTTSDGSSDSYTGTVTLVPSDGSLVGSDFLLNNSDWTIVGNKAITAATYESLSFGSKLNYYIYGTDDKVNVKSTGGDDQSLWYFNAPSAYLGNMGIAYGGYLRFTLGSFSGDFTKQNSAKTHMVLLECATCEGPVSQGITLGFSISNYTTASFNGDPMQFDIELIEGHGWVKDPQNSLLEWDVASKCDVIQVLSRLSAIKILGDWTQWYETVALDDVKIYNTQGNLPICAQSRNDASICTC
jgi:hypothetical protein